MSVKFTDPKFSTIFNTTFGRSSQVPKTQTHFINAKIISEDKVKINFQMIVNVHNIKDIPDLIPKYKEEGMSAVKVKIKEMIDEYKESSDESVKLKIEQDSIQDSMETVSMSAYSPNKTYYYRLNLTVSVSA